MTRLSRTHLLAILALVGVALFSSCATPRVANHGNASGSLSASSPTLLPTSTIDQPVTEIVSITSTTDVSPRLSVTPVSSSTVHLPSSEVATIPSEEDVPGVSLSPIPTSTVGLSEARPIPVFTYEIVNSFPHDREAFTQGLVYVDGVLYEGTGLRGRSTLRRVELETGNVLQQLALPASLFGEGVTLLDDKIYQLTWKAQVGFVYDKDNFGLLRVFQYPTEGWGITNDGERLIMSDGTSTLHFLDPETLEEIGQIEVSNNRDPVTLLNELEYIRGEVYANIWKTDRIARIDPQTGRVTGWINLAGLLSEEDLGQPVDVLNGIAYDVENDRLFVTGKLWPKIFEIRLLPEVADTN
jgi:glutamine cyclotransferase